MQLSSSIYSYTAALFSPGVLPRFDLAGDKEWWREDVRQRTERGQGVLVQAWSHTGRG